MVGVAPDSVFTTIVWLTLASMGVGASPRVADPIVVVSTSGPSAAGVAVADGVELANRRAKEIFTIVSRLLSVGPR